jgi:hypothetical protein
MSGSTGHNQELNGLVPMRGIPVLPATAIPFTAGNIWHVRPSSGSDSNSGYDPQHAFKTLAQAQNYAVANQNDIVLMYAESDTAGSTTDYQPTGLNWAKDGVHLIGVSGGPFLGQRARIGQLSTVKTIGDLFTVSANGCLISGIEVYQGVTSNTASSCRAMVVSGERNSIVNCQISGIGDTSMDLAGSCSFALLGQECRVSNCYIGLDTVTRGTTATYEMQISYAATRALIENCIIASSPATAASATWTAVTWTGVATNHSVTRFRNTIFSANKNIGGSTAAVAGAMSFAGSGQVEVLGGGVFGYTNYSASSNSNILILSYAGLPTHADYPGIAAGQQTT